MRELALKDVKIDEFGHGPQLADGMNLCAGCEDVFTLGRYCGFCQAIHEELQLREAKRSAVDRIDNGTVEFEEPEVERPASAWAVGVIFFGALCSAMLTLTVLWFGFHGLIAFCLRHSKP